MPTSAIYQNTPVLSRFPTDASMTSEFDRALLTPPDKTTSHCRVVARGHLVPAHSPDGHFIGTPFSTSSMFEYPFHQDESSPREAKPILIPVPAEPLATSGKSNSPTNRVLREVSREAPIPPSLREKTSALGA